MLIESIGRGFDVGTRIRENLAERGYRRRTEDAMNRYNAGEIDERTLENELASAGQRGFARGLDLSATRDALREDVFSMRDREDMRKAARAQLEGNMVDTYNFAGNVGVRRGKLDVTQLARRGLDEVEAAKANTGVDGKVNIPAAYRTLAETQAGRGNLADADQTMTAARQKRDAWVKDESGLALSAAQMGDTETAENKFTSVIQALGLPLYAQIDRENPDQLNFVQIGENGEQTVLGQSADLRELTMLLEGAASPSEVVKQLADSFRAKDAAAAERSATLDERRFEITKQALDTYFKEGMALGPGGAAFTRVQQAATQAGLTPKRALENGMLEYQTGDGQIVFLRVNEEGDESSAMGKPPLEWTDATGNPIDISKYAGENVAALTQAASAEALSASDRIAQLRQANTLLRTVLDVGYQSTGAGPAPRVAGDPAAGLSEGLSVPSMIAANFPGAQITSGLRGPARNKEVGGVGNSLHMTGDAVDVMPRDDEERALIRGFAEQQGLQVIEYPNGRLHIERDGGGGAPATPRRNFSPVPVANTTPATSGADGQRAQPAAPAAAGDSSQPTDPYMARLGQLDSAISRLAQNIQQMESFGGAKATPIYSRSGDRVIGWTDALEPEELAALNEKRAALQEAQQKRAELLQAKQRADAQRMAGLRRAERSAAFSDTIRP